MNIMAHIIGIVGALYLAFFAFNTLGSSPLGYVMLIIFVMVLVDTIDAIRDDLEALFK